MAKPEKAAMVESLLIQMAQTGQIMGKLGESELISLLERVQGRGPKKTVIKVCFISIINPREFGYYLPFSLIIVE